VWIDYERCPLWSPQGHICNPISLIGMIANNFAANHIQGMVDAQAEFDQVLGNMSAVQLSYFLQPVTTRFNAFLAQANWMSTIQTRHSGERYLNCLLDHCLLKSFGWEVLSILHSDFQLCVDRILERKLYGDRNINRYMHVQLLFSILICRYSLKYAKERSLIEGFSHQKPAWEQEHLEVILWRQSRFRCFVEFVWSWAGRIHWCSSSEYVLYRRHLSRPCRFVCGLNVIMEESQADSEREGACYPSEEKRKSYLGQGRFHCVRETSLGSRDDWVLRSRCSVLAKIQQRIHLSLDCKNWPDPRWNEFVKPGFSWPRALSSTLATEKMLVLISDLEEGVDVSVKQMMY
jgi:hypothetical protein